MSREPFTLGGTEVKPGETKIISIPAARLYTDTPVDLQVEVIH
ncbi:MAG: succinylglutamate desuccinylase, partial [Gammaproteobacteria bacterium]